MSERVKAALEALEKFKAVTGERRRATLLAYTDLHATPGRQASPVDVTEDVVSIMDRLTETLDWGSGFFTDEDLGAFFRLADLLKIDVGDSVERPS